MTGWSRPASSGHRIGSRSLASTRVRVYVRSFWNSSISSPSGPLKNAMRIGVGGSVDSVTSLVSTVISAPAARAASRAAAQSSALSAMWWNMPSPWGFSGSPWESSK